MTQIRNIVGGLVRVGGAKGISPDTLEPFA